MTEENKIDENKSECMGRWKHRWIWIWLKGLWTDKKVCSTCGVEK